MLPCFSLPSQATYSPSQTPQASSFREITHKDLSILAEILKYIVTTGEGLKKSVVVSRAFKDAKTLAIQAAIHEKFVFDFYAETFTDQGFLKLLGPEGMCRHITGLDLSKAIFHPQLLHHLPTTLIHLNLSETGLDDQALFRFTHLKNLEKLVLNRNPIGLEGTLVIFENFKKLLAVELHQTLISHDEALKILQNLSFLVYLNGSRPVSMTELAMDCIAYLAEILDHSHHPINPPDEITEDDEASSSEEPL